MHKLNPATLWHGILFKEPSPTGSCLSDLIGLCKPKHKTPPPNTQEKQSLGTVKEAVIDLKCFIRVRRDSNQDILSQDPAG